MPQTEPDCPAKSSRVAAIDGLRGLLAVVVLSWHVCTPLHVDWLLACANGAVGLFFVLSGYVLTRGWDGRYGVFLIRRFLRLWPVYALCLAAGYAIAHLHPLWSEFIWYPFIGPNDSPSIDPPIWSLFFEAWMMPFMPLVIWAGSGSSARLALCIVPLMLASLAAPQVAIAVLFMAGAFLSRYELRNTILASAFPQWLGRISYSLYLSHALVLTLAVRAFGPWGGVAVIPVAFAIAWLVWRGVEQPSIWASRYVGRAAGNLFAAITVGMRQYASPSPQP